MTSTPAHAERFDLASWCGSPAVMPIYHQHSEIEVNFVQYGALTYLVGSRTITIAQGQLALFWAAVPHRVTTFEAETTLHWLTVPINTFLQWQTGAAFTHRLLHGEIALEAAEAALHYDAMLFAQWQRDLAENTAEKRHLVLLEVEARTRRLALSLKTSAARMEPGEAEAQPSEANISKAERMAVFIAQNFTLPLSVGDVAAAVDLHPNYAMHIFQQSFGSTILSYLTQYRIWHAQCLLMTTSDDVTTIAFDAGFTSMSRFYAAFKRSCRCTPRDYRFSLG